MAAKQPSIPQTYPAFLSWYKALPFTKQYRMQREAGFSVVDDDYRQLVRATAARVGLPATSEPEQVLFAVLGGRVAGPGCGCEGHVGEAGDVVAVEFPMEEIFTDTARFQNRTDAFSELSADAVAREYDPNKFDPVVLWRDPKNGKAFVLSGHSRHEGKRRRGDDTCPARFFQGTEAEAIRFARVDANRAANAESVVEDLKAYRLMRDGDEDRNLKPAKKTELNNAFRGKATKLEAWSYLNPGGLFIQTLSQDNRTEFPYLEKFATWVGLLRKANEELTNTHENDCFNFFYSDSGNHRLKHEEFDELVGKRLAWGKPRLFPECGPEGCKDLADLTKRGANAEAYKELELLAKYKEEIKHRLSTTARGQRTYTDDERNKLREQGHLIDEEMKRIRRDLGQAEAAPGLFGVADDVQQAFALVKHLRPAQRLSLVKLLL